MSDSASDWTMFHGNAAHDGLVTGSSITAANAAGLTEAYTREIGGAILSVPAIANGSIYVGTANGTTMINGQSSPTGTTVAGTPTGGTPQADGGSFHRIDLASGETKASYFWQIDRAQGDTHGFTGMGCTPAVVDGRVYFSAFDGRLRCLDAETLELIWITDLRMADLAQNQPITNNAGVDAGGPPAEGWSSPLVVNNLVYVGMGEGENPDLYSFVFAVSAQSGKVAWIFCLNQFELGVCNSPNVLPADVVDPTSLPAGITLSDAKVVSKGNSVWTAIAFDADLNRLYCTTGNPQPDNGLVDPPHYAYGVLCLDALSGDEIGFFQAPEKSNYRPSDIDVDFGAAPMIFERGGQKICAAQCKNGTLFLLDAETMECVESRQMLPTYNDGCRIATVDTHGPDTGANPNPPVTNKESDATKAENFYGGYSTPAVFPGGEMLFVGSGGNNYHFVAPGIDSATTPFMRAVNWETLTDAWALDDSDPKKYVKPSPPMYASAGEAGLSSPTVVNDIVICTTSKIALHVFDARDGTPLFSDHFGMQTSGFNGGYGYCLGAAVSGDYIVAGGLVLGRDGGILRVFKVAG
ncbi:MULTISPECIES: outer membrane protein assembly factor BamB family protein [unclassified Marinovum]